MNREMNTTILLIQNAQLRDELSDAHKQIDSIQVQLNQADSDKQAALQQIRQEYEDKMSLMEAAYIRKIEQRDQKMRTEINQIKESSRMKLLEKEQEIERLQESNVILPGIYTLIESCDFNHLSPIKYISYLLKALHGSDVCADHRSLLPCNCEL